MLAVRKWVTWGFGGCGFARIMYHLAIGPDMLRCSGAEACNHERRFVLAELRSIVRPDFPAPASLTCAGLAVLTPPEPGA